MPHVTLAPLPRHAVGRVAHLDLPQHQSRFVATIAEMTDEPDILQDFHMVLHEDMAVGFFKIDRDYARRVSCLPSAALGFRGLLIGGQFQGQGLGRATLDALPSYISAHHAQPTLWLSVDHSNTSAIDLYKSCGWRCFGAPYHGRFGPERIMRLDLS